MPTPLQSSHSSYEEKQWQIEVEDQIWNARDRTVNEKTKHYLEESDSMKVEVEELESLLGPEDSEVDFRRILEEGEEQTRSRDLQKVAMSKVGGDRPQASSEGRLSLTRKERQIKAFELQRQHVSSFSFLVPFAVPLPREFLLGELDGREFFSFSFSSSFSFSFSFGFSSCL